MNALELHILSTLSDRDEASLEGEEPCKATLAMLESRGLLEIHPRIGDDLYEITEKGQSELDLALHS